MEQLVAMQRLYHESAKLREGVSLVEKGSEMRLLRHSWSGQLEQLARQSVEKSESDHSCPHRCYEDAGMVARGVPTDDDAVNAFRLATACAAPSSTLSVCIHGNGSAKNPQSSDSMIIEIESPHLAGKISQTYGVEWRTECERGERVCCIPARRIRGIVDRTSARDRFESVTNSSLVAWGGYSGYGKHRG